MPLFCNTAMAHLADPVIGALLTGRGYRLALYTRATLVRQP